MSARLPCELRGPLHFSPKGSCISIRSPTCAVMGLAAFFGCKIILAAGSPLTTTLLGQPFAVPYSCAGVVGVCALPLVVVLVELGVACALAVGGVGVFAFLPLLTLWPWAVPVLQAASAQVSARANKTIYVDGWCRKFRRVDMLRSPCDNFG